MAFWSSLQVVCCSCRYWTGRREISFTGDFYEALDCEGKCCNPHGAFRGCIMNEGASCSDYECFK